MADVSASATAWVILDVTTIRNPVVYGGPYLRANLTNPNTARYILPTVTMPTVPSSTRYPLAP